MEYRIAVSPHHQSANGKAERSVQIVKRLWNKCEDKYLAILDYNTTPLENIKASPAQLLMGRRPRNLLPAVRKFYEPRAIKPKEFSKQYYENKEKQKFYYDRKAKTLEPPRNQTPVRLQPTAGSKVWTPANVTGKLSTVICSHFTRRHIQKEQTPHQKIN